MFDRIYEAESKAKKLEEELERVKEGKESEELKELKERYSLLEEKVRESKEKELDELLREFNKKCEETNRAKLKIIDFLEENFEIDIGEENPHEVYSDYDWIQPFEEDFLKTIIKERSLLV